MKLGDEYIDVGDIKSLNPSIVDDAVGGTDGGGVRGELTFIGVLKSN